MPETSRAAQLEPISFRSFSSTAIGPGDWIELRNLVQQTAAADPGMVGFVILHGSATPKHLFSRSDENAQRNN